MSTPLQSVQVPVVRRSLVQRIGVGRLLLYPAMIYMIAITQIPFLITIYYSFRNYRLNRPDQHGWAGVENYQRLWDQVRNTDSPFFSALLNTVVLTAGSVVLAMIVGLLFAELVNHKFPGRAVVRTLLITPFLIMPAAAALSWKNLLYNPNFGFLDWFTTTFIPTSPAPNWLGDYPLVSIMLYLVWRWAPFMMLIFLAGMGSISEEVREAARVDGASAWQEFRTVTLPHLQRFFMLGGLLGTVYIFQDFDPIYLMTKGGPGNESTTLSYLVFRTAIENNNYGLASAIGVVTVILSIIAVTYLIRLLSRVFEGELRNG
ncbi:MAG TPA: sugar ABC transporter permease [Thermomicrobiales bacterium]|jgi:sorbitol/mannitol transport system permease protein|nr:sugar ABC transporter permease [Thermomicrobiales bacterium]